MMREAYSESIFYAACILAYVLLANVTMMGILGGLLVRTVATVADVEKEEKGIMFMKETMSTLWDKTLAVDENCDGKLSHAELTDLVTDEEACRLLDATGVDLDGLVNLSQSIFRQYGGALTKGQFIKVLLDLRGKNAAKVKDHVETRRFIFAEMQNALQSDGRFTL